MFRVTDITLKEPRIRVDSAEAVGALTARGLCRPGDGPVDGWMVLVDDIAQLRAAARDGAVAVVWHGDEPPQPLNEDAGRLALPVVRVPADIPITRVQEIVSGASVRGADTGPWRRLAALGRLTPSMAATDPETDLAKRVADMTGHAVLMVRADGGIIASTGEMPAWSIRRRLRGATPEPVTMHVGRWAVLAQPVDPVDASWATGDGRWFIVGHRGEEAPTGREPVVAAGRELFGVLAQSRRTLTREDTVRATSAITALIHGGTDDDDMTRLLAARGFPRGSVLRVIVGGDSRRAWEPGAGGAATAAASAAGRPLVLAPVDRALVAVTVDGPHVHQIAAAMPAPAGVSGPVLHAAEGPRAWRCARVAALAAGERGRAVGEAESLTPVERAAALLPEADLEACARPLDDRLGAITDGRDLAMALVDSGFVVREAGRIAGVHPNTVRNRLDTLDGMSQADYVMWALWRRMAGDAPGPGAPA